MRKKNVELLNIAESLYLQGKTFSEISNEIAIKKKTIETWALKNNWFEKKTQIYEDVRKSLHRKLVDQITQNAQKYIQGSSIISQLCLENLASIYNDFKNTGKCSQNVIRVWSDILARSSQVAKNVIPDAGSEIYEKILQELKEINSRFKREN